MDERAEQFDYYAYKYLTGLALITIFLMLGLGLVHGGAGNVPKNESAILMFGWMFMCIATLMYIGYVKPRVNKIHEIKIMLDIPNFEYDHLVWYIGRFALRKGIKEYAFDIIRVRVEEKEGECPVVLLRFKGWSKNIQEVIDNLCAYNGLEK